MDYAFADKESSLGKVKEKGSPYLKNKTKNLTNFE